jgi:hypothetical protein
MNEEVMRQDLQMIPTDFGVIRTIDESLLIPRLTEVKELAKKSKYFPRINYLLYNKDLSFERFPHMHSKDMRRECDRLKEPNCLGTLFYVTGVSKFNHPYHGWDDELKKFVNPELKTKTEADSFCFSGVVGYEEYDWHGGLCIGKIEGIPIMFAQHGAASYFGFESISSFKNPEFYKIP